MLTFIFSDVNELNEWRDNFIELFDEVPRITAKIVNGEHIFKASVSL